MPTPAEQAILSRFRWKRVEGPKTWRPTMVGETLVGYYGGKSVRNGKFGQYEVVLIHVPERGTFMISGVRAVQQFDAAGIQKGWPVQVIWKGIKEYPAQEGEDEPRKMKLFEVMVAEGDPVSENLLPQLQH